MAEINLTTRKLFYGTDAQRLAQIPAEGMTFLVTDTPGLLFEYTGTGVNLGDWELIRVSTNGAWHAYDATLRAGEDQSNNVMVVEQGQFVYETVAASQTAQVLGVTGAAGDLLHSVIITESTGTITVLDDTAVVAVIPAVAVGVWMFDAVSVNGAWKITTEAATSCTCIGRFTA